MSNFVIQAILKKVIANLVFHFKLLAQSCSISVKANKVHRLPFTLLHAGPNPFNPDAKPEHSLDGE